MLPHYVKVSSILTWRTQYQVSATPTSIPGRKCASCLYPCTGIISGGLRPFCYFITVTQPFPLGAMIVETLKTAYDAWLYYAIHGCHEKGGT